MNTILVIEDDPRIQKALHRQFTAEGFDVRVVGDGAEALGACRDLRPTAVVLDLMLPGVSGRELCRGIKAWSSSVPVIILSAVSEVADKVLLLEMGADDYVTKPFSPRELLARVQAAIRRTRPATAHDDAFRFGDVLVDFRKMELLRKGTPVELTAHEFKLLKFFLENAGRAVTREQLLNEVWGYNSYPTTRTVDNQILKLRQKLEEDPANPVYFRTIHGTGYKFVREA